MKNNNLKLAFIMLLMFVFMTTGLSGCNSSDYTNAQAMLDSGSYDAAISAFESLGGYKDSAEKVKEAKYKKAENLMESEKYDEAVMIFETISDYSDVSEKIEACNIAKEDAGKGTKYDEAVNYLNKGNYTEAKKLFLELGDYKDSAEKVFLTLQLNDIYKYNDVEWKVIDALGDNYILIGDMTSMDKKYDYPKVSAWYEGIGDSFLDSFPDTFQASVVYSYKGKRASALFDRYYDDYQPGGHHKQNDDDKKVLVVNRTNYSAKEELVSQHFNFADDSDLLKKCHIAMWIDRESLE